MSASVHYTVASLTQFKDLFAGEFLKGRPEPRLAFVGRSNVGKSTLLNAITESKVARTSAEPGKTRAIHFYFWENARKIVADLPGYGYAKQSKEDRDAWAKFIERYLKTDPALERAIVLIDARHGPLDKDWEAIRFLHGLRIPMTFALTKCDQLKTQSERAKRKKEVALALGEVGVGPERIFWVSAKTRDGLKALQAELTNG